VLLPGVFEDWEELDVLEELDELGELDEDCREVDCEEV